MTIPTLGEQLAATLTNVLVYLATPIFSAALAVLAVTDNTVLGTLISSLGSSGLMAWLIYYYVKVERPRLDKRQDAKDLTTQRHYEGIIDRIEANDKEKNEKLCRSLHEVSTALKTQGQQFQEMASACQSQASE
ncbi:hypothetical protein C5Y96_10710 [Blastopirellula marina]|uniref:Uncharacterized protein n=1 Tax=Blastopirellula marina TaxID=124 RepID=A0A2S8FN89_9BACT|nr:MULTISPECIES: hypothetical protein [Pirellulaceae]PQO33314.1 hypothetical protein C5Y96_10710 [Blastopirellula marina]RCS52403.1 hypothetical protein DTL36_10720 [Bremerella cremea]